MGGSPYQIGPRKPSGIVDILDLNTGTMSKGTLKISIGSSGYVLGNSGYVDYAGYFTAETIGNDLFLVGGTRDNNYVNTVLKVSF